MDFAKNFELMAQRELEATGSGQVVKVFVRIGKPLQMPTEDWACPYQVVGLGDEVVRAVYGIDAVQALQLTMSSLNGLLDRLGKDQNLTFLGEEDLDFPGFDVKKHFPDFEVEK